MNKPLHLRQSEAQFQAAIIEYAQARGWKVHAERPARSDKGWRTAIQGDAGFPDLVLARNGQIFVLELKGQNGRVSDAQEKWIAAISPLMVLLPVARVVRPSDWPWIEEVLA